MSKELEALEIFYKHLKVGTLSRDYGRTIDDVLHIEDAKELECIEDALTELEQLREEVKARQEVENSLTQWVADLTVELEQLRRVPTADEVCEAIRKNKYYLYDEITYNDKAFCLTVDGDPDKICAISDDGHLIIFSHVLTPDEINLISRFYMGVDSK